MPRSSEQVEHEDGLALFVVPSWRARFRESLNNRRRRSKLARQLYHFGHLDLRFATAIASNQQRAETLLTDLRGRGALERCWLVSSDDELDGRTMRLEDALAAIQGSEEGTFISCLPGRLAYFHGEEIEERYVLERRE